jgi:hypothetical protein
MSFRSVFISVVIAFALILSAFLINRQRPRIETDQPNEAFVRASGKCAGCHYNQQYSVVHEYELSRHAQKKVNCLDCHGPAGQQQQKQHHGFVIATKLTAGNCRNCHEGVYQEFLRSRHAATSWAAIYGEKAIPAELVGFTEQYQPGGVKRPPHPFTQLEGTSAMISGCEQCHSIGRPNDDGTVGTCTACHSRHTSGVAIARQPRTCGQCHMGPDHSQIEIYEESKHGIMFNAQEHLLNLDVPSKQLTTHDMFIPTCATCHMSGLNGNKVTHDPSERLSWYLANTISGQRPNYALAQANMKNICAQCHNRAIPDRVYKQAEQVVASTNEKIKQAQELVNGLRSQGALTGPPFSHPIDFTYFDLWHYDGRTSKHGAFMGGADFVQWHGNYPMLQRMVQMRAMADDLRRQRGIRAQ